MKKLLFSVLLLSGAAAMAQETMTQDGPRDRDVIPYNQWSIDVGAGVHKPVRPLAGGYFTNTPSFAQGDLGVRYMVNDKFGFNLDLGYNRFEGDDDSAPFKSHAYRVSLEGVVNAGTFLGFREWTDRFNFLVHAGAGVTAMSYKEPLDIDDRDEMLNFTVGVTPQLRLSDRVTFFGDLSIFGHVRQDRTFDGTAAQNLRGFDGFLVNASVGFSFALGGNEVHADWYNGSVQSQLNDLDSRVSTLETEVANDTDYTLPGYLDQNALDSKYAMKGSNATGTNGTDGSGLIKQLINEGYVNVYFEFNSTKPTNYSLSSINFLAKYMNENPSASANLTGYADELGTSDYNQTLSERRAKMVYDILVATGVDASRLTHQGQGEDASVEKSSDPARQLVRRVKFQVN
ncbi:OmpA family protein [Nonlabens antarcticus]|uniref:OmpA family protein n=1 Tax=Nonlabens antarcticus TaxID=392714 RepID=UPI001890F45C|nr:OmpA family protein [Nonlabens antarcticus]